MAASGRPLTASWSKSAIARSTLVTWTMSGSDLGRFFAAKMPSMASRCSMLAPSPYTVSVGKATRRPLRRRCPQAAMFAGEHGMRCARFDRALDDVVKSMAASRIRRIALRRFQIARARRASVGGAAEQAARGRAKSEKKANEFN